MMFDREYKKYDIVLVNFGDNYVGSEQGGIRPAIIVQNDMGNHFSGSTIVLPITSKIKKLDQPTHTLLTKNENNGLTEDSMVLGECMRQISKKRIIKYIGSVYSKTDRENIKKVFFANWEVA